MTSIEAMVRASDPVTSVAAAERAAKFAPKHADQIHAALVEHGQMTCAELAAVLPLNSVQIARRMPDLQRSKRARVVQADGRDLVRGGYRVWEAL